MCSKEDGMLTSRWIGTCAVAIAIGGAPIAGIDTAGAQTKATSRPDDQKTLTLTGCLQGPLQLGDEYANSFPSDVTTGTSGREMAYRLTSVTSKQPGAADTYVLMGTEKQLSAHLGHQVQIVAAPAPQPTRVSNGQAALRVESVKMVSAKCAQPRK
jgi:hypothetical protein